MRSDVPEGESKVVLGTTEAQARTVDDVENNRTDSQTERANLGEINDLEAWKRQWPEGQPAGLAQAELIEAVQQALFETGRPDVDGPLAHIEPESVLMRITPVRDEPTTISSLEALNQVEDFAVEGLDFEPAVEPLAMNDVYLKSSFEDDEEIVGTLLADLEEDMRQVEVEYVGELLVSVLADLVETEQASGLEEEEDDQAFQDGVTETEAGSVNNPEALVIVGFEEELSLYLQSLEPQKVAATQKVIEEMRLVLSESQQPLEENASEDKEITDHSLEELCVQLFEVLGLEYDAEITNQFIRMIFAQESLAAADTKVSKLSIDELNRLGTLEYKPLGSTSLLGGLAQLITQKMRSRIILGRYVLHELLPVFSYY